MRYTFEDLQDLYRLQNVQEYARAAYEVWQTATGSRKAQIAADLNQLWLDAGRWIDDDFYFNLPEELRFTRKEPYRPPASEVGAVWALFAGTVSEKPRGTSRRFRVAPGTSGERVEAFQRAYETAVDAAIACVNRHAFVVEENPFRWKGVWIPKSRRSELGFRMDTPLSLPTDPTIGYGGDSIGLSLGVCAFSTLTNTPIPNDVGCTGIFGDDGRLIGVTETQQKTDSLLKEHPEVRRILVARGSDPVVSCPDVSLKDNVDTLEDALNVIYEDEGGCAGIVKQFVRNATVDALELNCSEITSTHGEEHLLLQFRFHGSNVDARILTSLNTPHDLLQPLTTGRRVLVDGAKASWLSLYLGGRLANWATYTGVRQTTDPDAGATNMVFYVGWARNTDPPHSPLGKKIVWNIPPKRGDV